jgi:tetratricopeptide (TPR) repeat protein
MYDQAIECFNKVLSIDPGDAFAWLSKGSALYSLKHYEDALSCFEHALELDQQNLEAKQFKELCLEKMQHEDD